MLLDRIGRHITYLRLSVTDRCNLRCTYCMPAEGIKLKPYPEILRLEEMARVAVVAGRNGFTKVKITGGEPLIRKNIELLISTIAKSGHYEDIGMTTNGVLLTREKASLLRASGLQRVNISLDTLDPEEFRRTTRGGDIGDTLRGLDAALEAGLHPIKINMVTNDNTSDENVAAMRTFCNSRGVRLQTIRNFSLIAAPGSVNKNRSADRPPTCRQCNRLRVTADGYLKSCLFSDRETKVDMHDIEGSLRHVIWNKPECGKQCHKRTMSQIGG